ncbi:MAG TPA: acyltransferase family protein [Intrasporangium sp.]|uniref:acyltransferase family protein n=1 Tax=Intrasporangium sp. TaxID=1925024 RepID=UPI002D78BC1A|nr:acyltransferase family protein [Intrasporangium sp.]HET7399255.1 acyltransferase family protein [Intrasporangium sp.]
MTTSAAPAKSGVGRPADAGRAASAKATAAGPRIEGLDGLRALAIAAVLIFHLNASWLPGGFLGVDVFFVVSGFLITTLLVREHQQQGRIAFGQFWIRRARRLLPALVLCVVGSVLVARLVSSDLLVHLGRQVLGALTFSTNWVEITAGSSYFDQTAPQLFLNFWSLAVEEQFYLLWPAATLLLLRLAPARVRVTATLGVAAASTLVMAMLFVPGSDATRVYYGTDTHVMGLMIGAALAFGWASPSLRLRLAPSSWGAGGRYAVPTAAAVLLVLLFLLDETHAATFRGGILLASLATGVLVLGLLERRPAGSTAWQQLTGSRAAVWVGVRSYSIYLWHWPVVLMVARDNPSAPGTVSHVLTRVWCVLVTVALADLTFRFVETPFRRLGFRGVARAVGGLLLGSSRRTRQVAASGLLVVAATLAVILWTAPRQSETAALLEANAARAAGATVPSAPAPDSLVASAPAPSSGATTPVTGAQAGFTMPTGPEIDGYGDSMMVGSVHALDYYFPGIRMDARSNRRWSDGLAAVKARGEGNRRAVVLAFGTNAGVAQADVAAVLDALGPRRMVVLVNLMGPFSRIEADNAALQAVAKDRPNVAVADWAAAVRDHPEQLQSDQIHPSLRGSHLFAKTVRQALATLSERHTGAKVALKDLPMP